MVEPTTMFRKIKIEGYTFLFCSLVYENQKPFLSYVRLNNRKEIVNNNPLLSESEIYDLVIPQIEIKGCEILSNMIENNYDELVRRAYK